MMGRVMGRNTDVPHTWLSGAADSRNAFVSPIGIEADCDAPIKTTWRNGGGMETIFESDYS